PSAPASPRAGRPMATGQVDSRPDRVPPRRDPRGAAMPTDLIVTNALLVTADAAGTVVRDGALAVAEGRIARIGPADEIGRDAAEVLDARGMLLMPGLINTHCHAANSLFRGLVEDLPLEPWLQTVWKAEGAIITPDT